MRNGRVFYTRKSAFEKWWREKTKMERKLIIGAAILMVLLLLALFTYGLIAGSEPAVCQSSACTTASEKLRLNYVDLGVHPCEDFYRFSCGNFLQNSNDNNQSSKSSRSIMEEDIQTRIKNMLEEVEEDPSVFNLAKKFYRACMNESAIEAEGLDGMKQIFGKIGGWPTLVGKSWRGNRTKWEEKVFILRELGINFESFLILDVEIDKADPKHYIFSLDTPFSNYSPVEDNVKATFLKYMVDVAVEMGARRELAKKEQAEVLNFLLKLADISAKAKSMDKTNNNYYSISELQKKFGHLDWLRYITTITGVAVNSINTINVKSPTYLEKLLVLLENTNRTISNFICWRTLESLFKYLPQKILKRAYEYSEEINKKTTRMPRWNTCVDETKSRFHSAISAAYVKKHLDESTRQRAISMIRNIKYQFIENLYRVDWLDQETKDMARERLSSSVEDIPSYDRLNEMSDPYRQVEILEDKLLTSVLNLDYIATNIRYEKWRRPVNENFFEKPGSVTGLKIVYSPTENSLAIPVGLFQGIFYQKDRPEYMNHGALGTIIAHELYHIITEAEYKNSQGKLTSWWSAHSLLNYDKKLQCLVSNRYGKYVISKIEQHLSNSITRDEDMADLAGMKVAYDTYMFWVLENGIEPQLPELHFSPTQLFWISSAIHHCVKHPAQTLQKYIANYQHSPSQHRVNGALQNLEEFARDFGCPQGTKMNPVNKCRVW